MMTKKPASASVSQLWRVLGGAK
eukprot:COSAG04_NODE_25705_length_304_cov_0.756098_1_plen_22_part_10